MTQFDIERFVDELSDYFKYSYNKEKLFSLLQEIQTHLYAYYDGEKVENAKSAYDNFVLMIKLFDEYVSSPLVLILKNESSKFDFYIFRNGLEVRFDEVISSERFMTKLREKPQKGMVISDVESKEVLDFLKAYYLFRREPKIESDVQNIIYNYDKSCLEMLSILEKFEGINERLSLKVDNTILYDNDALPYDLGYLDRYKKMSLNRNGNNFEDILKRVREDKYLGTSLNRVGNWW